MMTALSSGDGLSAIRKKNGADLQLIRAEDREVREQLSYPESSGAGAVYLSPGFHIPEVIERA
jgi:hypothetical protein